MSPELPVNPEEMSSFPLYESLDSSTNIKCKLLWIYGQWSKKYLGFDFTQATETSLRKIQAELKMIYDLDQEILIHKKLRPYEEDMGTDETIIQAKVKDQESKIDNIFSTFSAVCELKSPDKIPLPSLTNSRDIDRTLHDVRNAHTNIAMSLSAILPKDSGIKHELLEQVSVGLNQEMHDVYTGTQKAYQTLHLGELPPERTTVPVERIHKDIISMFNEYLKAIPLSQHEEKRLLLFLHETKDTSLIFDYSDFRELLRNIKQNLKRVYDKRDLVIELAKLPRSLHVWYGFLKLPSRKNPEGKTVKRKRAKDSEYLAVVLDDRGLGFTQKIIEEQKFTLGESTQGGEGIGMYEVQKRLERSNIFLYMENYEYDPTHPERLGARIMILIPLKANKQ